MVTIIDYGMGNLGSVQNMFKRIAVPSQVTNKKEEVQKAEKILLPGVGAFDTAMRKLAELDLVDALNHKALVEKIPVLGICLGMQLLTDASEEGALPGLGWISGKAYSFRGRVDTNLKVPHMGWNIVNFSKASQLSENYEGETRFYFVHSFFVHVTNPDHSLMRTAYGIEFDSAVQRDNIFGAQFHPEKSHKFGIKLFENFSRI